MMMDVQKMIKQYQPNIDIFSGDTEDMIILKNAVLSLPLADQIIFLMYAECGSLRKVGDELGVSHTTIYKQIKQIRRDIYNYALMKYPNNNVTKMLEKCCM